MMTYTDTIKKALDNNQTNLAELEMQITPENMQIVFFDGYDEIRDVKTNDVIFKTNNKDEELLNNICDNIVNIWNKYLFSNQFGLRGILDYYLLYSDCSQDARELVIEKLYAYYIDKWLK